MRAQVFHARWSSIEPSGTPFSVIHTGGASYRARPVRATRHRRGIGLQPSSLATPSGRIGGMSESLEW